MDERIGGKGPENPGERKTESDAAISGSVDRETILQFAASNLRRIVRLVVLLLADGFLFVVWLGISKLLDLFAKVIQADGTHERAVFFLKEVASWVFFGIAVIYLLVDFIIEILRIIEEFKNERKKKRNR